MSNVLDKITSPRFMERVNEISNLPEQKVLRFMLGFPRFVEWAHSIGSVRYETLRNLVPRFPPAELRRQGAAEELELFLWTGLIDLMTILSLYTKHRNLLDPSPFRVLDFGCGCGRLTRFLNDCSHYCEPYACDVKEGQANWCAQNLSGIRTIKNDFESPLPIENSVFNLVYSVSVFTHLNEQASTQWLSELHRVLAPRGLLIATVSGPLSLSIIAKSESHQSMFHIDPDGAVALIEQLKRTEFVFVPEKLGIQRPVGAQGLYGKVFMTQDYVRQQWTKENFEVLEYVEGGLRGWQDIVVLRKV